MAAKVRGCAWAVWLAAVGPVVAQAVPVDPAIVPYSKASGVSGSLNSIGSDTLNNLMTLWAEGFQKQYPNVRIQIEGKGSSTAPPALIAGTAQLGPMSRPMKSSELDEF
jgi:phosphate transport system substrate-binding protein